MICVRLCKGWSSFAVASGGVVGVSVFLLKLAMKVLIVTSTCLWVLLLFLAIRFRLETMCAFKAWQGSLCAEVCSHASQERFWYGYCASEWFINNNIRGHRRRGRRPRQYRRLDRFLNIHRQTREQFAAVQYLICMQPSNHAVFFSRYHGYAQWIRRGIRQRIL